MVNCMVGAADIDDLAVAKRVERLRNYLGFATDQEFADALGVKAHRINNVLRGSPLSRDLAIRLVQKVPGLSVDWLWFNNASGMPSRLAEDLTREEHSIAQSATPLSSLIVRKRRKKHSVAYT